MSAIAHPAFDHLVEEQRADLHAHCYRMLGSLHDADDALQDTLLRAWRGLPGFQGRSSLRTWLYGIATNACLDAIVALLAEDATFSMPPDPEVSRGREAIAGSWLMPDGPPPRLRYVATRANGQPALGTYLIDDATGAYLPLALDVLTLRGDEITDVTVFRTPQLFPRFGLPDRLAA